MSELQAVILAAGSSRRFPVNKLLRPLSDQRCLLDIGYDLAGELTPQRLLVISPDEQLRQHCRSHGYNFLINSQAHTGMASSISAGVSATAQAGGWAIMLADMPCLRSETLKQLATNWSSHEITVPMYRQQNGHPVIFSHFYFKALCALQGDQGARGLLRNNAAVFEMDCDDPGITFDIDTQAQWECYLAHGCG